MIISLGNSALHTKVYKVFPAVRYFSDTAHRGCGHVKIEGILYLMVAMWRGMMSNNGSPKPLSPKSMSCTSASLAASSCSSMFSGVKSPCRKHGGWLFCGQRDSAACKQVKAVAGIIASDKSTNLVAASRPSRLYYTKHHRCHTLLEYTLL